MSQNVKMVEIDGLVEECRDTGPYMSMDTTPNVEATISETPNHRVTPRVRRIVSADSWVMVMMLSRNKGSWRALQVVQAG